MNDDPEIVHMLAGANLDEIKECTDCHVHFLCPYHANGLKDKIDPFFYAHLRKTMGVEHRRMFVRFGLLAKIIRPWRGNRTQSIKKLKEFTPTLTDENAAKTYEQMQQLFEFSVDLPHMNTTM